MTKLWRKRLRRPKIRLRTPPGSSPGKITPPHDAPKPEIQVMAYGSEGFDECTLQQPADAMPYLERWPVVWINVNGLGDAETIQEFGELFNLHPLALEDVSNIHHRAKAEEYGRQLFLIAKMVTFDGHVQVEQVSLFLGDGFVLSFQQCPGDCLDGVRERIRTGGWSGRIRRTGADYLMYALLDAVIDGYYPVLDQHAEQLDALEDDVLEGVDGNSLEQIHALKGDAVLLRRTIRPHRDAVAALTRQDHPLISESTRLFLRDCHDHVTQLSELVETDRELIADIRDLYMTMIGNRMNETMRVLTIIATLFIPLTFVAGVYGMNFDPHVSPWNMPELHWYFGYPFALALMAVTTAGMFVFFAWKGWLRKYDRPPRQP